MNECYVQFETEDGLLLEGYFSHPAPGMPRPGVILAHPHPHYGGSMETPLIRALAEALVAKGIATLRFNFRGVGRSEGTFGHGDAETLDLAAALRTLSTHPDIARNGRGIVGYSFGAWVGVHVFAHQKRVGAFAAIGMPLWHLSPALLQHDERPKLFITGDADEISPHLALQSMLLSIPNTRLELIEAADHTYTGPHSVKVVHLVTDFIIGALTP